MPKIRYIPKQLTAQWECMVDIVNDILEEYTAQGFTLTLRQLYYQIVARDLFPVYRRFSIDGNGRWHPDENGTPNCDRNYDWLGKIVNDGRMCGLIDWDYLIDRTRNLQELQHFDSAQDALQRLAGWYHVDFWKTQPVRPEVWIEKDALVGVIDGVCSALDVPYFSCRGYTSQSEMWRAAQRLDHWRRGGQDTYIIHLGDHDPSGLDMSRDIADRLELFMGGTTFKRVALNMDQVAQYNPPPNPAKLSDGRAKAYIAEHGPSSWELDALDPTAISDLIRTSVEALRDQAAWDAAAREKAKVRGRLKSLADTWQQKGLLPLAELAAECERHVDGSREEWDRILRQALADAQTVNEDPRGLDVLMDALRTSIDKFQPMLEADQA